MDLGRTLSLQGTNKIGNYETYYEFKPEILQHYLTYVFLLSIGPIGMILKVLQKCHGENCQIIRILESYTCDQIKFNIKFS